MFKSLKSKQPTLADLNQEYARLCAEFGDLTFKINRFNQRCDEIQERLQVLDTTAGKLSKEEKNNVKIEQPS